MLWVDTKELPGNKVLVHPKYSGNDFPYYFEVAEGKQLFVPFDIQLCEQKGYEAHDLDRL